MLGVKADLQLYVSIEADQLCFVVFAGVIIEPDLEAAAVHGDVTPTLDAAGETLECISHDLEEARVHHPKVRSGMCAVEAYRSPTRRPARNGRARPRW